MSIINGHHISVKYRDCIINKPIAIQCVFPLRIIDNRSPKDDISLTFRARKIDVSRVSSFSVDDFKAPNLSNIDVKYVNNLRLYWANLSSDPLLATLSSITDHI
jgi:hypothetical protein